MTPMAEPGRVFRLRTPCVMGWIVLDVTGLLRAVPVYPTVAEALPSSLTPTTRSSGTVTPAPGAGCCGREAEAGGERR